MVPEFTAVMSNTTIVLLPTAIRAATTEDARFVAKNLREDDQLELCAMGHSDISAAVMQSFERSCFVRVATINGVPAILYGVGKSAGETGIPWMLATPAISIFSRAFVRGCRHEVEQMQGMFPKLANMVHHNNKTAMRWLQWLGFVIHSSHRIGPGGQFYLFTMGI